MREKILALLLAVLLAGCATGAQMRLDRFDSTARAYQSAIRWSEFEKAYALSGLAGRSPLPDYARLKQVRVTSYETVRVFPGDEGRRVEQIVEIRFVLLQTMAERSLTDRQVWEYSESDKRWYLRSAFPEFR